MRVTETEHQEILSLWTQIRDWRQEAGLQLEPSAETKIEMAAATIDQARNVCPQEPEPTTKVCKDVCNLSDAICENADSICRIADNRAPDTWSEEKCTSAKASCKDAKKRCCECDASE